MTNWFALLEQQPGLFITISLSAAGLLLLLVLVLWINLLSFKKKFKQLMKGATGENLEELLKQHVVLVQAHQELAEENRVTMKMIEENQRKSVQYVGVKRFNAFEDVGSRLSYSIALLDDHLNGVVLTGLHGRYESTTYAKAIDHGHSEQHLSVEEMDALQMAREQQLKRNKG
ncbi:DUF4446 family protein [Anoxynatronum buryatiense]|uniref:DUF4446 family protein n=1 Tax=Anoxynatronum buryatiense TaxID=489973 RepID=A0AA45WW99_9CLOT|nr:DUF4446 family protein [Anoxynatronum buryatiense]SMP58429.1 Protein of unknown function [Anoxynatronum buryatiense]